ncbi:hypothetical protein HU200_018603 [Digitaria exilis]|uniref:Late embryogenesis abundant protein LEA-2 subgroup domain-containing protein n=1 Tax=Digitaria exilis TaxID=1010633 RepID=A0A835F4U2_9POAL|nr:hypothetical protein HU200_018603 [Digitaria exilis]
MPASAPERGNVGYGGRPQRVAVLRCIVAAVVVTVLLAGLAVLIFWLVVRPKPIDYAVTHAVVRHFNVTPPPPDANANATASVNATFYLTFAAHNPNRRVSILYEWVEFRVLYGGGDPAQLLAVEDAPAFRQPRRNETALAVRAVARSANVSGQAARELRHDAEQGEVGVDVRMRARVQFKVAGVRTRHYDLEAFCSPVVVGLSPSAARSFQTVPCDVAIS